ncbi:hypothetical protein [Hoeflea poritis]|uniref:Uncharacterized protein n=1 Tax=Hoeflea poritis TaxID=2993659 RepID=A0ABT4VMN4_9HYPH|nr:hypothetical protein [Hoeflea poritis]MDA4845968.1 hypothetical protein [Hoeflea poritis]
MDRKFRDMPPRIAKLRRDERGFPIPYFVAYYDGKPDFRVADENKLRKAIEHDHCWICGEKVGKYKAFVIGPMCGINRTISEPPQHRDCAIFAARNCPFLANPMAKRNERGLPYERKDAPGKSIRRNPGACGVWISKHPSMFRPRRGNAGILFDIGDPVEVLWFCEGREATLGEIRNSIETGLPILFKDAQSQGEDAVRALEQACTKFDQYLPAA